MRKFFAGLAAALAILLPTTAASSAPNHRFVNTYYHHIGGYCCDNKIDSDGDYYHLSHVYDVVSEWTIKVSTDCRSGGSILINFYNDNTQNVFISKVLDGNYIWVLDGRTFTGNVYNEFYSYRCNYEIWVTG